VAAVASPAPVLSQSSVPRGLRPGSWAVGSLGVYWESSQENIARLGSQRGMGIQGAQREGEEQVTEGPGRILSGQQLCHLLLGHDHVLWDQLQKEKGAKLSPGAAIDCTGTPGWAGQDHKLLCLG
jgi:hypothetical protein